MIAIRVLGIRQSQVGRGLCAYIYLPGESSLHPALDGKVTPQSVEAWLGRYATDFKEIKDFQVESQGKELFPWQDPKSEERYAAAMGAE